MNSTSKFEHEIWTPTPEAKGVTKAKRCVVWWAWNRNRNNKDVAETRRRAMDDGIPDYRARAQPVTKWQCEIQL